MNLRIGTSGWNYPAGAGTWKGIFYPARGGAKDRTSATTKFDELAYYAERFDTVEVNSTFYRPPSPEIAKGWIERTPAGFEFSLKLHQKFTHPEMFKKAVRLLENDVQVTLDDVDEFRAGIDPIASAGRLGALLVQFPASFKCSPESQAHLEWLLNAFGEYPLAVELRHRSWSDQFGATLTLLNEHGAAWAQIDEPKFRFSIQQNYLPNVTGFYYMRLHGRNAAQWWRHDKSEDRYNYLYTEAELKPFAETADAARRLVKKLYLYMNNHFSAKSVANALMLKHELGLPITSDYTPELVRAYPELEAFVPVTSSAQEHPSRLFS